METKSIHKQILNSLNLKIGDTVLVTHSVPSYNLGWKNYWNPIMNKFIGKKFKVILIDLVDNYGGGKIRRCIT